jgi:TonB family protein
MKIAIALLALLPFGALAQSTQGGVSASDAPIDILLAQHIVPPSRILSGHPCGRSKRVSAPVAMTGTTIIAYNITSDGAVTDITVEQSSGSADLDSAVVECAATYRYKPATKDGQAVEVPWKFKVDWAARRPPS